MLEGGTLTIRWVVATFFTLALVTVCLRCYVRLRIKNCFGWDDAFMVLAMLIDVMFTSTALAGTVYGFGKRFDELDPHQTKTALLLFFLAQGSYIWVCIAAKLSISILLLRITVKRVNAWILYGVMVVTVVVGTAVFLVLLVQCQPVSYFWDKVSQQGHCDPTAPIRTVYVYSVSSAICDFVLGLLPVALVWSVQMNRRTKISVICILSMGCIASCAVVVRIPFLQDYKQKDFLYATSGITIFSHLEAKLGIAAGSLATLHPLLHMLRRFTHPYNSSSHQHQSPTSRSGYKDSPFALRALPGRRNSAVTGMHQAIPSIGEDDDNHELRADNTKMHNVSEEEDMGGKKSASPAASHMIQEPMEPRNLEDYPPI